MATEEEPKARRRRAVTVEVAEAKRRDPVEIERRRQGDRA